MTRLQTLDQPREHSLDLASVGAKFIRLRFGQETEITGQQNVIFQFACRAHRNVKELFELGPGAPSAPFSNVSWNGRRSPSHLAGQTVPLFIGEEPSRFVDKQSQVMAFSPDVQLFEVLHRWTDFSGTDYRTLITQFPALGQLCKAEFVPRPYKDDGLASGKLTTEN